MVNLDITLEEMHFDLLYIKKSFENDEIRLSSLDDDIEQIRSFISTLNHHASRLNSLPIHSATKNYIDFKIELIGSELKKVENITTELSFPIRWNICRIALLSIISCLQSDISCLEHGIRYIQHNE